LASGIKVELSNVRYIPDLTRNLISLGTFEKEGYAVSLKNGKAKVVMGSRVVLSGTRCDNNIYLLDGGISLGASCAAGSDELSKAVLWHRRLGHISDQGLSELKKQQVLDEFTGGGPGFYEHCIMGKAHKVRFATGRHSSRGILDYVHSDLWGPARTQSVGGSR
jgi:hypothetical protein